MSDTREFMDAAAMFQRFPDTWDTIYQYIKKLEQQNDALNKAVESLRTTLWGMETKLEKAQAENAALRADKERLDWLEKHRCFPGDYPEYDVGIFVSEKYGLLGVARAIDAARANGAK